MGELQQGNWNTGDWPVPVELGVFNNSADAHAQLMFGAGHMLPPHFRQRFQAPLHLANNQMLSMAQHHMNDNAQMTVDNGNGAGDSSDGRRGEAHPHSLAQSMNLDNSEGMESDEQSEDDEEDEEDDEDDDDELEEHTSVLHELPPPHALVEEESLSSCQQASNGLQTNAEAPEHVSQQPMIPGVDDQCHAKAQQQHGMLRQNILVQNISHSQNHQGMNMNMPTQHMGSHTLSMNPMMPSSSMMMPVVPNTNESYNNTDNNGPQTAAVHHPHHEQHMQHQPQPPQDAGDYDGDTGFSVYGKMYFEGRVVLHLKQRTDAMLNNGISVNACASHQQAEPKSQLNGCALCRLKSGNTQGNAYRYQKEAHRHAVRGVLFTFEECIIVELYQEQNSCYSNHPNNSFPKARQEPEKVNNSMVFNPYAPPVQLCRNPVAAEKRMMEELSMVNMMNTEKAPVQVEPSQDTVAPAQSQDSTTSPWWEDFESTRDSRPQQTNDHNSSMAHVLNTATSSASCSSQASCSRIPTMKANLTEDLNPLPQSLHPNHNSHPHGSTAAAEYKMKWKCDECLRGFQTCEEVDSHNCPATSPKEVPSQVLEVDIQSPPHTMDAENDSRKEFSINPESNGNSNVNKSVAPENDSLTLGHALEAKQTDLNDIGEVRTVNRFDTARINQTSDLSNESQSSNFESKKLKYTCPVYSCSKGYHQKKFLKVHAAEDHCFENTYSCPSCGIRSVDDKLFLKHDCNPKHTDVPYTSEPVNPDILEDDVAVSPAQLNSSTQHESESHSPNSYEWKKGAARFKVTDHERDIASGSDTSKDFNSLTPGLNLELKEGACNVETKKNDKCNVELREDNKKLEPKKKKGPRKHRSNGALAPSMECTVCSKVFTVQRRLQKHMLTHNPEKSSQCEKCGKRFARKDKLIRHMYVHSEEKMFVCDICEKRFSRRDKLTDHLKSHGTEEVYNCPFCQKQFLRPDILKQHVKLHGMGNKHQCPECLRFVTGEDRLMKHMARHEEAKALGQTLLCPLCTKYFIQRQSLKAHIKKFHPDALKNLENQDGSNSRDSRGSGSENTLIEEVGSNPPVCSLLENVMGSQRTVCTKPRPFSCTKCEKDFVRKQALKKHLRKHAHQYENEKCPSKEDKSSDSDVERSNCDDQKQSSNRKKLEMFPETITSNQSRNEDEDDEDEEEEAEAEHEDNGKVKSDYSPGTPLGSVETSKSPTTGSFPGPSKLPLNPVANNVLNGMTNTSSNNLMTHLAMASQHHQAAAAAAALVAAAAHHPYSVPTSSTSSHSTHNLFATSSTQVGNPTHLTNTCVPQFSHLNNAGVPMAVHPHMNGTPQNMCPSSYLIAYPPQYTFQ